MEVWEPEEKGRFRLSHRVTVNQPWVVFGRSRRCDVPLSQPTISARHAYVQAWSGRALCYDLDSRSGTQRDVLLPSSGSGPGAAELAIGRYGARILAHSTGHSTGEPTPGIAREPSSFWLEFFNRTPAGAPAQEEQPQIYRPTRAVTLIGRSPACRIQLQSRSISRIHCSLVQTASGVWIVDLLSRTGVRVNGRLVEFARLNDGDHLQIGRFEMNCLTESSGEGSM
ncbi:MAG: FHA domain-containing protein, partial [Planctomycetaceae bacterium]|nr:FHA domain-containing protein [Planctomycetaceae bacterium]